MCGRFSLGTNTDTLIHEFGLAELTADHQPRFNVAPTQDVAAVVRGESGLRLGMLRWGLVPAHARSADGRPLINARSESVHRRPSFADSFRRRRCWILADGFFEWTRAPDGARLPHHVRAADGRPFAFAGIWDRWEGGDGAALASCAILTTDAASAIAAIHARMPVILSPDDRDRWLDPHAGPEDLTPLLRPYDGALEVRRVTNRVNSAGYDDPSCLSSPEGETSVL